MAGPSSVVVVGAGIMGICTAYYLMKSGHCSEIYLLEEGEVAGGASGKAAGFLARDWHGTPTAVGVIYWGLWIYSQADLLYTSHWVSSRLGCTNNWQESSMEKSGMDIARYLLFPWTYKKAKGEQLLINLVTIP